MFCAKFDLPILCAHNTGTKRHTEHKLGAQFAAGGRTPSYLIFALLNGFPHFFHKSPVVPGWDTDFYTISA